MSDWYIYMGHHAEFRRDGREVTVYDPVVIPKGGTIMSAHADFCGHRHTSPDAAMRCARRRLRWLVRKDLLDKSLRRKAASA